MTASTQSGRCRSSLRRRSRSRCCAPEPDGRSALPVDRILPECRVDVRRRNHVEVAVDDDMVLGVDDREIGQPCAGSRNLLTVPPPVDPQRAVFVIHVVRVVAGVLAERRKGIGIDSEAVQRFLEVRAARHDLGVHRQSRGHVMYHICHPAVERRKGLPLKRMKSRQAGVSVNAGCGTGIDAKSAYVVPHPHVERRDRAVVSPARRP